MIEIIKEKEKWDTILGTMDQYDFYHTYDYQHISKNIEEEPVLIHYTEGNRSIALPLLLRSIADTPYMDATSVYGYAGPLTCNIDNDFDNTNFKNQLLAFFKKNNLVAVFSRLHPYIPIQQLVLKNMGEVTVMGKIVNVDLTKNLESQKKEYQKRLRTYINKERNVYTIIGSKTESDVLKFIDLYYENMRRVNADSNYFFKKEYFFGLLKSEDFKTDLLLARCNDSNEIVGGAMFIKKNNIVQYHLSGAKEEYLNLNPIKVLIDEARINATNENYTYFNLGGGKGGKEDSLFRFKAGFSKDFWIFSVWKYIINKDAYDGLVQKTLINVPKDLHKDYLAYFPHYRSPGQTKLPYDL